LPMAACPCFPFIWCVKLPRILRWGRVRSSLVSERLKRIHAWCASAEACWSWTP
jgi:hypothetical protein